MNVVVVGSVAAKYNKILVDRNPADYDIFADEKSAIQFVEALGKEIKKIEPTDKGMTIFTEDKPVEVELIEKCENTYAIFEQMRKHGMFASPDWLYFLKMSHRFKKNSPHFWKTAKDIHYWRSLGIKMPSGSKHLFEEREKLTYNYKHPNLNVSKKDFFSDDGLNYIYDHDDIHRVVAIDGKPAYTNYLKDGSPVFTDKDKFFACKPRVRMLGFVEEAMVLTAERSLIPFDFKPDPHQMFVFSVSKVCSSITSGYFREWCYDHIFQGLRFYSENVKNSGWVEKLQSEIEAGTLRKHNELETA